MRIAIEASSMLPARTGVGYYTYHLCQHLARHGRQHQIKLFLNSYRHRNRLEEPWIASDPIRAYRYGIPGPWLQRCWRYLRFPPLEAFIGGFDVLHATASFLPARWSGRSVLTVHDLYFLDAPDETDKLGGKLLAKTLPADLKRADAIIAVSVATKRDLRRHFPEIPERKIHVIYEAADPRMVPVDDEQRLALFRSEYALPDVYILAVGTIEPRKNLPALFAAYRYLKDIYAVPPPLVVVGMRGWKSGPTYQALTALELTQHDVVFTDYVPHEHMPLIYAGARMFVFPSKAEGFGLPLVEAMACGLPVVASDIPVFREIAGDAASYAPPDQPELIAQEIAALLRSREKRRAAAQASVVRARRFDWSLTAQKTLRLYEAVVQGRPAGPLDRTAFVAERSNVAAPEGASKRPLSRS